MADPLGHTSLTKVPSGIGGLDEITAGGLPGGRSTLVCGAAGSGKTLFGLQFLVRGIRDHDEPGVFFSFEESSADIAANVRSLGWDVAQMEAEGLLLIRHNRVEPGEVQETGTYDLGGLFVQLAAAIDEVGAKRVVIDTLEALFAALTDATVLRAELRRLMTWLKDRGVTSIITSERGEGKLTRFGLEEYVSDCVVVLDHRIDDQLSTRRLRVVKYRGSAHNSDECPFVIDEHGFTALPMSSLQLRHGAPTERVSTGVPRLDAMLGGAGYYRGSSILVSGNPGSGKTTLAGAFVAACCARGERVLLLAFEESPEQLTRNLRSVGIDLQGHVDSGLLRISSVRPSAHGLESHLVTMRSETDHFDPSVVIVDPLSAFGNPAPEREAMFTRLVDLFKSRGITALCTSLASSTSDLSGLGVSSVIDTWLALSVVEHNGERNRGLTIIKSRGMRHSNQVREFRLTDAGIRIIDVYTGSGGVLMGTARQAREAEEEATRRLKEARAEAKRRRIERRRAGISAQIEALRHELEEEVESLSLELTEEELDLDDLTIEAAAMAEARGADLPGSRT